VRGHKPIRRQNHPHATPPVHRPYQIPPRPTRPPTLARPFRLTNPPHVPVIATRARPHPPSLRAALAAKQPRSPPHPQCQPMRTRSHRKSPIPVSNPAAPAKQANFVGRAPARQHKPPPPDNSARAPPRPPSSRGALAPWQPRRPPPPKPHPSTARNPSPALSRQSERPGAPSRREAEPPKISDPASATTRSLNLRSIYAAPPPARPCQAPTPARRTRRNELPKPEPSVPARHPTPPASQTAPLLNPPSTADASHVAHALGVIAPARSTSAGAREPSTTREALHRSLTEDGPPPNHPARRHACTRGAVDRGPPSREVTPRSVICYKREDFIPDPFAMAQNTKQIHHATNGGGTP
jgi:hypothetical protein